jgi:molybdenum cofactor guanylyltransferase
MDPNIPLSTAMARRRRGAIVLCGGKSRRMGEDKAWLPFGNDAMLTRVVRIIAQSVPACNILVIAADGQQLPPLEEHVRVLRDAEAFLGPLPAIVTGLNALLDVADDVFVTSCDVPLLRASVVDWLFWRLDEVRAAPLTPNERPFEAVVPRDQHRWYPLSAVYSVTTRIGLSAARALGDNSLQGPCRSGLVRAFPIQTDEMREVDPQLDAIFNCNTWYDYESALERATESAADESTP